MSTYYIPPKLFKLLLHGNINKVMPSSGSKTLLKRSSRTARRSKRKSDKKGKRLYSVK